MGKDRAKTALVTERTSGRLWKKVVEARGREIEDHYEVHMCYVLFTCSKLSRGRGGIGVATRTTRANGAFIGADGF